MNANELADELEHYLKGEEYDRLVWEIPDMLRQQQAEIEALKTRIERMIEDRSKYEAMAHAGGVEVGKELLVKEVMSENCTCYKLGYSQLNDYRKVEQNENY
jgi:hypothetical protein